MSHPCHSSSLNCQRVTEKFWHYWKMILRPLNIEDRDEALQAHAELALDDFSFLLDAFDENEPWKNFMKRVSATSRGEDLPNGYDPATFLVALKSPPVAIEFIN